MPFPRVLVVTGSAGHGHVRAAQAVASALRHRHPSIDVAELDALVKMARWYGRTYRALYTHLVDRLPNVWRKIYETTDQEQTAIGHALTVLGGAGFVRAALTWRPDLILCTHFLAPELLVRAVRRGRTTVPIHIVITDHDAHRVWWYPEVAAYYVASETVKARLVYRYQVPPERIAVTGIPVSSSFSAKRDLVSIRARYGLDPTRPTVLFLSAGFAAGDMARSILGVWAERPDVQVVAVCGTNVGLRSQPSALPRREGATLHVLGFVDDVPDLMAVSDLVVSKSGGLSMSECMAMGRPLLISASIPGQEERNADAAVAAGGALKALTPEEVRWHVVRLLSRPEELRAMTNRARSFGRPRAADDIADRVAERLGAAPVWLPPAHGARASVPRR